MIKNIIFTGNASEIPKQVEMHRRNLERKGKKVNSVESYLVENGKYYIIEVCSNAPKEPVEMSKFIEDDEGNIYKVIFSEKGECDEERYVNVDVMYLSDEIDEMNTSLLLVQHNSLMYEWVLNGGVISVWNLVEKAFKDEELKKVFKIKFK